MGYLLLGNVLKLDLTLIMLILSVNLSHSLR